MEYSCPPAPRACPSRNMHAGSYREQGRKPLTLLAHKVVTVESANLNRIAVTTQASGQVARQCSDWHRQSLVARHLNGWERVQREARQQTVPHGGAARAQWPDACVPTLQAPSPHPCCCFLVVTSECLDIRSRLNDQDEQNERQKFDRRRQARCDVNTRSLELGSSSN